MGERKREIDRGARGRLLPVGAASRSSRRPALNQREREGPCRSAMKAQSDNPLSHAPRTPARRSTQLAFASSSASRRSAPLAASRCRWPSPFRLHRLRFPVLMPPIGAPRPPHPGAGLVRFRPKGFVRVELLHAQCPQRQAVNSRLARLDLT